MAKDKGGGTRQTAPAESAETLPVIRQCSLIPARGTPLMQCPTNLDLTSKWGKAMAVNCGSPGDLEFDGTGMIQATITHYLLYPDETVNEETGEVEQVCRTCLITPDGRVYKTTSQAIPHALHRFIQCYTPEEWAQGLRVGIFERRSPKTKRTYHDMRILVDPEDRAPPGAGLQP